MFRRFLTAAVVSATFATPAFAEIWGDVDLVVDVPNGGQAVFISCYEADDNGSVLVGTAVISANTPGSATDVCNALYAMVVDDGDDVIEAYAAPLERGVFMPSARR